MWFKVFEKDNIKILVLENLIKDKVKELRSLCKFLGIKYKKELKIEKKNYLDQNKYLKYRKQLQVRYKKINSILIKKYKLNVDNWLN